ncbi:MAG: transcription-repair coupling factor [Deltaproteobacteria bacterium]|nr:transcription-repair coupling factor [Deltaproteobacteria bacterium]
MIETNHMKEGSYASLQKAAEVLRGGISTMDAVGLEGSALAFLAARSVVEMGKTLLVVVPGTGEAEIFFENVRFFLGEGHPSRDQNGLPRARLLPPWDAVPGDREGPGACNQARRIETLWTLGCEEKPCVTVTSAAGLMQRVVPREFLSNASFQIFSGDEFEREELAHRLMQLGYLRVPLVEERGEFSIRGGVLDLYPPSCHWPVRLEFIGDMVESIRHFHPETQRSSRHLEKVQVLPARELPMGGSFAKNASAELRHRIAEKGYDGGLLRVLQEKIEQGVYDPRLFFLLPLFFPRMETLLDFLPNGAATIVLHPDRLRSAAEEFNALVHKCFQPWQEDGFPSLSQELYLAPKELSNRLEERSLLRIHEVEIADVMVNSSRVLRYATQSNADLRREILAAKSTDGMLTPLIQRIFSWLDNGIAPAIVCRTGREQERLAGLLEGYGLRVNQEVGPYDPAFLSFPPLPQPRTVTLYRGALSGGFRMPAERLIFITEEEIFGERIHRERPARRAVQPFTTDFSDLRQGDFVAHVDHGIGRYRGLERLQVGEIEHDFLHLEYAGNDRLYIPVDRLNVVQKYVGQDGYVPRVDRLGGTSWAKAKKRVEKSLRQTAEELLRLYAARSLSKGHAFSPSNSYTHEFEASFQYEETPDQARSVEEVYADMERDRPMDRLVCGDVGYGKTEVAMRAAFKAVMDGKQVAMLVPTTVLAEQHLQTFKERFQGYPVEIEALSRFRTYREQKLILRRLKEGRIDILIGTHRMLSKDLVFHSLGLLIVDEEQRFGVAHKERIKKLRSEVDVLTLTATPIPRTLNMSLMSIRDLSVIETPPEDRLAIHTQLSRFDPDLIREAIHREMERGGQVFFVHNRVQSINNMARFIQRLVPQARIGVAHGQMPEYQLEQVMLRFIKKEINILVCTNIIESGLDIPTANTIVINRADRFGLADIYQLRGRVGRSKERAYAYLLIPPEGILTPESSKRLQAVLENTDLGAGFKIALKDLEIRGAGNIIGRDQSGHIAAVGYEMYIRLLEKTVHQLKGEEVIEEVDPEIHLPVKALLPQEFVPDTGHRLQIYRRLSTASSAKDVEAIREEMADLFGPLPQEALDLLKVMHIRVLLKRLRIRKLDYTGRHLVLSFDESTPVSPSRLVEMVSLEPRRYRWISNQKLTIRLERGECGHMLGIIKKFLNQIYEGDNNLLGLCT